MFGINLPNLGDRNHRVTSEMTPRYNCISWSVREDLISLWPDDDNRWPTSVTREESMDAFLQFYTMIGFERISLNAIHYEPGYEKIALYADTAGPCHAARQIPSGRWLSKLGRLADIEHNDLNCLEGGAYGNVVAIFKRLDTGSPPALPPLFPDRPLIILP